MSIEQWVCRPYATFTLSFLSQWRRCRRCCQQYNANVCLCTDGDKSLTINHRKYSDVHEAKVNWLETRENGKLVARIIESLANRSAWEQSCEPIPRHTPYQEPEYSDTHEISINTKQFFSTFRCAAHSSRRHSDFMWMWLFLFNSPSFFCRLCVTHFSLLLHFGDERKTKKKKNVAPHNNKKTHIKGFSIWNANKHTGEALKLFCYLISYRATCLPVLARVHLHSIRCCW